MKTQNEPTEPTESMNAFQHRLSATMQRVSEQVKIREKQFKEWLAKQQPTVTCKYHDFSRPIDESLTWREWHETEEHNRVHYMPCPECERLKDLAGFCQRVGIPKLYIGATLEQLVYETDECKANIETCKRYTEKPKGFLVLLGEGSQGVGCGKTHIACAILQKRRTGLFITQSELLAQHRATYRSDRARDIRRFAMESELLALDEVGVSVGGKDEEPLIYDILNYRYSNLLPTIFTSNVPEEQLRDAIGERIADRLKESCFGVLHFEEGSKRKASKDKYLACHPDVTPRINPEYLESLEIISRRGQSI